MSKKIIYRLTVYATMPLTEDAANVDIHTLETATTGSQKREVERHVFSTLKHSDYDCDVELMDFSVEDE
jgi:hypothetical protein